MVSDLWKLILPWQKVFGSNVCKQDIDPIPNPVQLQSYTLIQHQQLSMCENENFVMNCKLKICRRVSFNRAHSTFIFFLYSIFSIFSLSISLIPSHEAAYKNVVQFASYFQSVQTPPSIRMETQLLKVANPEL